MPKNAKKSVYRQKEFEMYVLWKSIPPYFRGMKKDKLFTYGFTDPLTINVATIKNQTAFAKKFNIKDLGTLTDWNNIIKDKKMDTNPSRLSFKKQFIKVDSVISKKVDRSMKRKLYESEKIISKLKMENLHLKEQLRSNSLEKINYENNAPLQPKTVTPLEVTELYGFFFKIKKFLRKYLFTELT